jgi:hypothetical protein
LEEQWQRCAQDQWTNVPQSIFDQEAAEMMNSNRVREGPLSFRDPKERFLSAYLDKAVGNNGSYVVNSCCRKDATC